MSVDLRELAPLYDAAWSAGTVASVYLPTHRDTEAAGPAFDVLWKDTLRELDEAGVDEATREALDAGRGSHADGGTLVLFAAGGRLLHRVALPEGQDTSAVRVAALPYVLPLADWASLHVPHIVALVDREGADLLSYGDGEEPVEATGTKAAHGNAHRVARAGLGGLRVMHAGENTWDQTAKIVAEELAAMVSRSKAQLVLLAGDARELHLVRSHLVPAVEELVTEIEGSRATDGGDAALAGHVLQALAAHQGRRVEVALEGFATYRGRAQKDAETPITDDEGNHTPALNAAEGVTDVLAALRQAQVGTLLLGEGFAEDEPVWIGPDPLALAYREQELLALGVQEPRQASLGDALLRAVIGSDAEVRFVPGDTDRSPREGVGALLRYSSPAS